MIGYEPGCDVGALERWPLDNPQSDYRILAGTPETWGRLDAGGPGHTTRFGIWRCSPGAFECTEQGDELMTVIAGNGRVIELADETVHLLRPGLSLFLRDGARVRWQVDSELTKVFFGHKPDGY